MVKALMIAGVAVLPLPALALGCRGVMGRRRITAEADARASLILLVVLRLLLLLLILALSAVSLVSVIGALIKDVDMPSLVYDFFWLDLLLAALVLLTFGRLPRRRVRRPVSPAAR